MSKSLLCLLLLLPSLAAAQSYDDEYYPFAVREEPQPMIVTDTSTAPCRSRRMLMAGSPISTSRR